MKFVKRGVFLAFVLAVLLLCLPVEGRAEVIGRGTYGNGLTWVLNDDGVLTISGEGEMPSSGKYSAPWERYGRSIKNVVIDSGVTSIGDYAFYAFTYLTDVTIPDSVTSIGRDAFWNCFNLTGVTIPDSVTSIGEGAFCFCSKLTSLTIPDSVTSIGENAFESCESLTSVTLPDGITSIGDSTFKGCKSLTNVNIPDSVTSIGKAAFDGCDSLTDIAIPDGVTSIGREAFSSCNSLSDVTIPYSVTSIGSYAFSNCDSLTHMTIPYSVTSVGAGVFQFCVNLTDVTIFGSVTSIEEKVFTSCNSLTSVTLPDSVTSIGELAFSGCTSLTDVYYSGTEEDWANISMRDGNTALTNATIHYESEGGGTTPSGPEVTEPEVTEPKPTEPKPTEPKPTEPEQPDEPETINITRLAGDHRYETAFLAANQLKVELGIEKFDAVVVASGTSFADALSGSYLAAVKNAPILLASGVEKVDVLVKDYIKANLRTGGTVYILGGESAVPGAFEDGLDGFAVKRLAGGNRFETNLMVLEEAGIGDKPVLICTGLSFADSLSASAAELPILLVWKDLSEGQEKIITEQAVKGVPCYIIGGESAVSAEMENAIAGYGVVVERVAGGNRFETSVAIAEKFFEEPDSVVLAYAWNFPDGLCGGPLAAAMDAPLILTMDKFEGETQAYVQGNGVKNGVILGGTGLISETTVNNIFG